MRSQGLQEAAALLRMRLLALARPPGTLLLACLHGQHWAPSCQGRIWETINQGPSGWAEHHLLGGSVLEPARQLLRRS